MIKRSGLKLKLDLDFPQLFTAENYKGKKFSVSNFLEGFTEYTELIVGIHIWGRKGVAHIGNIASLFEGMQQPLEMLKEFAEGIKELFDDDIPRYFVPEVNSSEEDLQDIVLLFKNLGSIFEN